MVLTSWRFTSTGPYFFERVLHGPYMGGPYKMIMRVGMSLLWKQDKCSFLVPPRGTFWDSMSLSGCQINTIDVNFYLQKYLEIFYGNSADKIWSEKVESALTHAKG